MRWATVTCCGVLVSIAGCTGTTGLGFGPFPTSGIGGGQLTAGVASFVPGVVPGEGEFALLVFNTDSKAVHRVTATPLGGLAITRNIAPCSVGNYAMPCDAVSILVQIEVPGQATFPSLTIVPVPGACTQRLVYISVPVQADGGGTGGGNEQTEPPTLTETVPPSVVNCGVGGVPAAAQ